jgi:hypothetical protein
VILALFIMTVLIMIGKLLCVVLYIEKQIALVFHLFPFDANKLIFRCFFKTEWTASEWIAIRKNEKKLSRKLERWWGRHRKDETTDETQSDVRIESLNDKRKICRYFECPE